MILFTGVILSSIIRNGSHMGHALSSRLLSFPTETFQIQFAVILCPCCFLSQLQSIHQPQALCELLFTLQRLYLSFRGEMEQKGGKMLTGDVPLHCSIEYMTRGTHTVYSSACTRNMCVLGCLILPLFSIILPHTSTSQEQGPSRLHSKYSQGWRQSNMNFNELLNRIIYLLPPRPEPPNWQIYIAFFFEPVAHLYA